MQSQQLREAFISFFTSKQHTHLESASLIPEKDPSLLFTNSGMVPFKPYFLGELQPPSRRVVSVQKSLRAGGKHNDLDNVGYTHRHHTFFEMLGNFSFGDYFKEEAIGFAWEFITKDLAIPKDRLWFTVYEDDDESENLWKKIAQVSSERVIRLGKDSNFWQMADVGPCGPCSEIFYDHGPSVFGDKPGTPDEDGDRYTELWNLVFMQFDKQQDGILKPLPKPCVDTGMGLERMCATLQGTCDNYESDLFLEIFASIARITGLSQASINAHWKVIADHLRSVVFLLDAGVIPCPDGRGYVLRRILRRGLRHAYQLGWQKPLFSELLEPFVGQMATAYPSLLANKNTILAQIQAEEQSFLMTLKSGMHLLEKELDKLEQTKQASLKGDVAFTLYDTYGFPVDLTADILRERQLDLDEAGYEAAMAEQKARSRSAKSFANYQSQIKLDKQLAKTEFVGYEQPQISPCEIIHTECIDTQNFILVLDKTPFYAESGGQVGDRGTILQDNGVEFEVVDTQKKDGIIYHTCTLNYREIPENSVTTAQIDQSHRLKTSQNHTATHLLHAILEQNFGSHIAQKGSSVTSEHLRFDFSHPEPISKNDLKFIEQQVNEFIQAAACQETQILPLKEAIDSGAKAFFSEKYEERVRVVSFVGAGFRSIELCGGTHVASSLEVGSFKILHESGIAAGIRRIEAVAGVSYADFAKEQEQLLARLKDSTNSLNDSILEQKLQKLLDDQKSYQKLLQEQQQNLSKNLLESARKQPLDFGAFSLFKVDASKINEVEAMRNLATQLAKTNQQAIAIVYAHKPEGYSIFISVHESISEQIGAGDVLRKINSFTGGKGGGKKQFAQGGGPVADVEKAIEAVLNCEL